MVESFGYLSGVVNLTCEASAEPPATYEWTKGNQSIVPRNNVTIIKESGRSVLQVLGMVVLVELTKRLTA